MRFSPWPRLVVSLVLLLACQNANVRAPSSTVDPNRPGSPGAAGGESGGAAPAAPGGGLALPDASDTGTPVAIPPGDQKCAEDSHQAERAPVDLLFLVDTSGSMADKAGTRSKWAMVRDALVGFLKDPRSAGLGVGLQFFPLVPEKTCTAEAECPSASPLLSRCYEWKACGKAGDPVAGTRECEPNTLIGDCNDGSTCLPVGRCSVSGKPCLGVDTPCAGGMAGDMCGPRGKQCRYSSSSSCEQPYGQPTVPIGPLPQQEALLVGAIDDRVPRGGTPMGPGVTGALTHLRAHSTAHPDRKVALVLVSDGLPDGFCNRNNVEPIADALTAAHAMAPSLPAYVIGVFSAADAMEAMPGLTRLAMAGGTGMPSLVTADADLSKTFTAALEQIRGTVLPCEFKIPPPATGTLDYGKVNVSLKVGAGTEAIPYVGTADRCDPVRGGWHYDRDPATGKPETVQFCPATCSKVKADPSGRVDVRFGCKTISID